LGTKLYVAGGLIGAIAAALSAVFVIADVNAFRAEIAAAIEAETGRKIEFGGDIALKLGRTTVLTVNDVRLANVAGGSGPDMLRIAKASAEVAVMPLWRGEVVIRRLVLQGADILVDIDRQGRTNFDFIAAGPAGALKAPADGSEFLLQRIGDVDIRDSKITIRDARDGKTQRLTLRRLRLRDGDTENLVRIAAAGRLDIEGESLTFDLEGRVGRIAALVAQDKPYPVDVRGTVDDVTVAAAGTIADPFAATGLALRIDLSADDLKPFEPLFGVDLPPVGPAHLTASLTGTPKKFTLGGLSFELDDSRISGDLLVDLSDERLNLEGRLAATWLDLSPWLASAGETQPDRVDRVLNNDTIDFTALQDFDGDLAITAETVIADDLMFRDAALSFELKDGRLRTAPAHARFDGRAFSGALTVDSRANPPEVALKLTARDFDVGRILGRIFDEKFIHGTGGMDLAIAGRGWSVAEIVGSSAGHARLLMDAGEVKTGSLGLLVGGVSEFLPGLGSGKGDWTAINCVAADFDLRGGVATSRVTLLDSEVLRLVGKGEIDLAHDTIEYYVAPSAKNPTLSLAVPVNLSGPLADPSITPDELSLLRRLGGLVGAVIFPPAALLSLGSLGSHDNPCLEAVRSVSAPPPAAPQDWTGHPEAEAPPEVGSESPDRLIDAVKQLLPLRGNES
jgi:uncharacterized protein involved in outer membrane biogenesis